ncbi:MAG: protein translocase subunit SecD [Pseudohongiellaceae bacterium]|nr:protein translocase subunit SecD [Pseudohongiellaceae bacterium]
MLNKFPLWKNLLVVIVIVLAALYSAPNLYPDDPAVQVSHEDQEMTEFELGTITDALRAEGVEYFGEVLQDRSALVRFNSLEDQLRGKSIIERTLGSGYFSALNLAPTTPSWLQAIGAGKMNLGLDLQGGVHFLMEVDMDAALERRMENSISTIRQLLRTERIRSRSIELEDSNLIAVTFSNEEARSEARSLIRENFADLQPSNTQRGSNFVLELSLLPADILQMQRDTIAANKTTILNRVDSLGVSEPVVQQQGVNRIVVELPGVQDTAQAKRILQRIATLQFHLQAEPGMPSSAYTTYEYQGQLIDVNNEVILQGDRISSVRSMLDQNQQPSVVINLDAQGGEQFSRVTRENVNKLMDIVLSEIKTRSTFEEGENGEVIEHQETYEEKRLISHATIRQALGREFSITGLTTLEANELSLLIRSGALAAPMYFVEERTLGPSLGAENIKQGSQAVYLGFGLVLVFMIAYYRLFGLAANVALAVNLLLLVAVMSIISATLTLPGIFGIVLIVGMAVDANVLIFTRVREELASGLSPQGAISAGFDRAFSTIMDANITTLLVGIVLFSIGTGPVKGFAVTLMIGILTSMFTAIIVTRAVVNWMYGGKQVTKLSIGPYV